MHTRKNHQDLHHYDVAEFRQRGLCGIFCDASRCVMGRVYELRLMGQVLAKVPRRRHHLECDNADVA